MLVLSRKQNQTVVIDNQVEIEVLKIKGNTVKLGIKAPSDIKVLRGELSPFEIEVNLSDLGDSRISSHIGPSVGRKKKVVGSDNTLGSGVGKSPRAAENVRLPNPFAVVAAASN